MKIDMSREAVEMRLQAVSELARAAVACATSHNRRAGDQDQGLRIEMLRRAAEAMRSRRNRQAGR